MELLNLKVVRFKSSKRGLTNFRKGCSANVCKIKDSLAECLQDS